MAQLQPFPTKSRCATRSRQRENARTVSGGNGAPFGQGTSMRSCRNQGNRLELCSKSVISTFPGLLRKAPASKLIAKVVLGVNTWVSPQQGTRSSFSLQQVHHPTR